MNIDAKAVLSFLKNTGVSATLRHNARGTYVAGTGLPSPTVTNYTVQCKIIKTELNEQPGEQPVESNKLRAMVAASGLAITPGLTDQIITGGFTYNITDVYKVSDGATALVYICTVES